MIALLDFGSQTTHLIQRRIKELGAKVYIFPGDTSWEEIRKIKPKAIILSGGPSSVYEKKSPLADRRIFAQNIPILGICYGLQSLVYILGGTVSKAKKKEFGPAKLTILDTNNPLFNRTQTKFVAWMSHGDEVKILPRGFTRIAQTDTLPFAAIQNEKKKIYGIQFHPEVSHTVFGTQILSNFLTLANVDIKKQKIDRKYVETLIQDIKNQVGKEKVICGISGGIDSTVTAYLVNKAVGRKLTCVYVDPGLMRKNETETVLRSLKSLDFTIKTIDAQKIFLNGLEAVSDPERKRKIIGEAFIDIFNLEAKKLGAKFLAQGTIYSDVIESKGTKHAHKIKSHHNVAGLPKKMKLKLVEPLRFMYKDEVRAIGKLVKIPKSILQRDIFPGPGLAVRIIGPVTKDKLNLLREADAIVAEELEKAKLNKKLWMGFAILTGIKTTGVKGDARSYGETIAIRAIEAKDAMTARWSKLPYSVLDKISIRLVNELKSVNRVVYDITNKPPGTMEWE
jgi:GMP synthase (glutamine-hydrolysing)